MSAFSAKIGDQRAVEGGFFLLHYECLNLCHAAIDVISIYFMIVAWFVATRLLSLITLLKLRRLQLPCIA